MIGIDTSFLVAFETARAAEAIGKAYYASFAPDGVANGGPDDMR